MARGLADAAAAEAEWERAMADAADVADERFKEDQSHFDVDGWAERAQADLAEAQRLFAAAAADGHGDDEDAEEEEPQDASSREPDPEPTRAPVGETEPEPVGETEPEPEPEPEPESSDSCLPSSDTDEYDLSTAAGRLARLLARPAPPDYD